MLGLVCVLENRIVAKRKGFIKKYKELTESFGLLKEGEGRAFRDNIQHGGARELLTLLRLRWLTLKPLNEVQMLPPAHSLCHDLHQQKDTAGTSLVVQELRL